MILSRSGNDKMILASVQAALGIGGLVGSLIVSIWGGPGKKVVAMMMGGTASFLLGDIFLAIGSTVYDWTSAAFLSSFFIPFIIAAQNVLWLSKVDVNMQGRIFSIRGMLQQACLPVGYLLGGFLADYIFEPTMSANGRLANVFEWLIKPGKSAGMALMFLFTGILGTIICIGGYFIKDVRRLDDK
jgi:MFS transporter, DHA3 family, macrolide efflux protein